MMKKIENLLKTSYARITTSEEPNEKKWVFSSVHNRAFNYNSSALFEYVKKYHPEIQAFYVMEDPVERKKLQECFGKESIIDTSTMEGIRKVLECKVWFTSTAPPLYGMGFRKKYCIINLWHGVPLKKIGMEQENLGWMTKLYYKYLFADNYEAVVTTSEELIPVMSRSFLVEQERVKVWGQPRNDKLFEKINVREQMQKIFQKEKLPEFDSLLLYAPTFRDDGETRLFPFEDYQKQELEEFLQEKKIHICIRMHLEETIEKEKYLSKNLHFVNEDVIDDIAQWMGCFDLLITDYSSIYLDYLLLDKPMIFLPYDKEEYLKDRGMNYSYDEVTPGAKPETQKQLLINIEDSLFGEDRYRTQRRECNAYFNQVTGPCCAYICQQILQEI